MWEELPRSDAKIMLQNGVNDSRIKVFTAVTVDGRDRFPEFFGDGAHKI